MTPLYIYVTAECAMCARARSVARQIREQRPAYPVYVVELDTPGAIQPAFVFGTPTYTLGNQIISLGNPGIHQLLNILDAAAHNPTGAANDESYEAG